MPVPAWISVPKSRARHIRRVRFHVIHKEKKRALCLGRRPDQPQRFGIFAGRSTLVLVQSSGVYYIRKHSPKALGKLFALRDGGNRPPGVVVVKALAEA